MNTAWTLETRIWVFGLLITQGCCFCQKSATNKFKKKKTKPCFRLTPSHQPKESTGHWRLILTDQSWSCEELPAWEKGKNVTILSFEQGLGTLAQGWTGVMVLYTRAGHREEPGEMEPKEGTSRWIPSLLYWGRYC